MSLIVQFLLILFLPFGVFAADSIERPSPTTMVIFGATGDLTSKKILPAIEQLAVEGRLPEQFALVAVARKSEEEFRKKIGTIPVTVESWGILQSCSQPKVTKPNEAQYNLYYSQASFDEEEGYEKLAKLLNKIDQGFGAKSNRIYFIATPPSYFSTIVEKLHSNQMIYQPGKKHWSRVLIEKPFGHDLNSALELQKNISQYLDESQIYRIDHYLGKEGVQNLTDFRLNQTLEETWNRQYIEQVQITISEEIGIGSRGQFWEETGLLRDIIQNHLMQLLSLVAMEVPSDAKHIPEEKMEALNAIQPVDVKSVIRGQYGPGEIRGSKVLGYKEEKGVSASSTVETYAAATFFIDNDRWQGIPFTLQAGKRLPSQLAEIVVHFKSKEVLHIRIQPDPAIFFEEGSNFSFDPFPFSEAYQKLIVDAIKGDQSSFVQQEEQMAAWQLLTPVLDYWQSNRHISLYPAGTSGP